MLLIVIEIIATYFMYKSGTNKEVVLDNVELKELTDSKTFAIYLDGEEYTASPIWPEDATFEKAECQNEKGDIVTGVLTFNESENKAYLNNITQTTYCYLYFTTKTQVAPTCTLSVSNSEVTIIPSNAEEYGLVSDIIGIPYSSIAKTYNSKTTLSLETNKSFFGLVKNSVGEGYCAINVVELAMEKGTCSYSSTVNSGSGGETICSLSTGTCTCRPDNHYGVDDFKVSIVDDCSSYIDSNCPGSCIYNPDYPKPDYLQCRCTSTSQGGYVCSNDNSSYSSQTECEEKCVFGETSCSSGTQISTSNGIYCYN